MAVADELYALPTATVETRYALVAVVAEKSATCAARAETSA
jgi:hypothetical protein